jgi:hypothetical protein
MALHSSSFALAPSYCHEAHGASDRSIRHRFALADDSNDPFCRCQTGHGQHPVGVNVRWIEQFSHSAQAETNMTTTLARGARLPSTRTFKTASSAVEPCDFIGPQSESSISATAERPSQDKTRPSLRPYGRSASDASISFESALPSSRTAAIGPSFLNSGDCVWLQTYVSPYRE